MTMTTEFTCRTCGATWEAARRRGQEPWYCTRKCKLRAQNERAKDRTAEYRKENRDELRRKARQAYTTDPGRFRGYSLKARYGITLDEYEAMLERQGGCAICGARECQTGRAMPVDHDHRCCPGKTSCGKCVRGVLCHSCNATLLPGYEALPPELRDSSRLNAYLDRVVENDPLLIGAN